MNVMLMKVIERTREIGVRRAVGARRGHILRQFLTEAVTQTLTGALLGIGIGVVGSLIFCAAMEWQLKLSVETVLLATSFSVVTGILFGVYPAIQASQLKPIDCLRYE
jgi:ABC-type antimicrobial peptide transport system permease subunit